MLEDEVSASVQLCQTRGPNCPKHALHLVPRTSPWTLKFALRLVAWDVLPTRVCLLLAGVVRVVGIHFCWDDTGCGNQVQQVGIRVFSAKA